MPFTSRHSPVGRARPSRSTPRSLSTGAVAAYVGLWDDNHHGVPLWLYDVGTQMLATALPQAAAVDGVTGYASETRST